MPSIASQMATFLILLLARFAPALAYVPAKATNDTSAAQAAGQNVSDASWLTVQWDSNTFVMETVSLSLSGVDSLGISEVCVRFCLRVYSDSDHGRISSGRTRSFFRATVTNRQQ